MEVILAACPDPPSTAIQNDDELDAAEAAALAASGASLPSDVAQDAPVAPQGGGRQRGGGRQAGHDSGATRG
eukprot:9102908-Alexandrium_andersonii.AAC.1